MPGLISPPVKNKIPGLRILDNTQTMATEDMNKHPKPEFVGQALLDALDDESMWQSKPKNQNRSAELAAKSSQAQRQNTSFSIPMRPAQSSNAQQTATTHLRRNVKHPHLGSPRVVKWWHDPGTPVLMRVRQPPRSSRPTFGANRDSTVQSSRSPNQYQPSQEPQNKNEGYHRDISQLRYDQYGVTNMTHSRSGESSSTMSSPAPESYRYQSFSPPKNDQTPPSSKHRQVPCGQPQAHLYAPPMLTPSPPSFDFCNWNGVPLAQSNVAPPPPPFSFRPPGGVAPFPFGSSPSYPNHPANDSSSNSSAWVQSPESALLNNLLQQYVRPSAPASTQNSQLYPPTWLQPLQGMVQKYQSRDYSTNRSTPFQPTHPRSAQLIAKPHSQTAEEQDASIGVRKAANKRIPKGVPSLPVPIPTPQYMARASLHPRQLNVKQSLLVILDLNGTLLYRSKSNANFKARPQVEAFLNHILQYHFVMIWSSAQPVNVSKMVEKLFTSSDRKHLVAEWARDTLRLNQKQLNQKVQVYKQLSWVWASDEIAARYPNQQWDQRNTVLIDDSVLKASAEPFNLVEIPEFEKQEEHNDVLGQVTAYIDWLSSHEDVSCAIRAKPFQIDTEWQWNWE